MDPIIETRRLILRELGPEDTKTIERMLSDRETLCFYGHLVSQAGFADRWIERNRQRYRQDGFGLWAVEERSSGRFLGDCGLTRQSLEGREYLEVGYHLDASARGQGFATEAARVCLAYAFDVLKATTVVSIVDTENLASRRVAERIHDGCRAGFTKNGREVVLFLTQAGKRE